MSNQEHSKINLQKTINENYDQIKAGTYEWSDDEVDAVYKLANSYVRTQKFKNPLDREDFLQEVVSNFFSKYIKCYDITKNIGISTFAYKCMENDYGTLYRRNSTKLYLTTSSLNNTINSSNPNGIDREDEGLDLLMDNSLTAYEYYILDVWKLFLNEEYSKTVLLKEMELNEKTQLSLAKQYNVSQTYISLLVKIEKDIIFLRAINENIPIPDKYSIEIENMKKSIDKHKQRYTSLANVDNYKQIEKFFSNVISDFVKNKINNQSNKQME